MEKVLWAAIISDLKKSISPAAFKIWFSQCHLKEVVVLDANTTQAEIVCSNNFAREQLEKRYQQQIINALNKKTGKSHQVIFKIAPPVKKNSGEFVDGLFKQTTPTQRPPMTSFPQNYTFENFVVGTPNKLAVSAAETVVCNPQLTYNPLFFYGLSGVGKTHLLHAIAHRFTTSNEDLKVVYQSCEQFTNNFIDALITRQIKKFRQQLRNTDVLLVDDIQFLATKESTQEEFFHTFNELYLGGKQIILTSDKHPVGIAGLEKRLVSRFLGGLMVEINPPDFEMRMKLIQSKAKKLCLNLPTPTTTYLARKTNGNIRELEGLLFRVASQNQLNNQSITLTFIKTLLSQTHQSKVSAQKILAVVQKHYHLNFGGFSSQSRRKNHIYPRQIAMFLLRDLAGMSFSSIGRFFGDRDHSTVIHSVAKIQSMIEKNPTLEKEVDSLKVKLSG